MKIVVVGGSGDIGSCVVEKLLDFSSHQITIAGRDLKRIRAVSQSFKDYVGAVRVDVNDRGSLTSAFGSFDLVINCVGPFYKYSANVAVAAIETRTHYIDICDDPEPLSKLFALDGAAKRAGITAITGMGWSPGISNVAVRLGANLLDEIDDIKISWAAGSSDSKGLAALKHTLHGFSGEIPVVKDGEQAKIPAWSEMELVEFPAPLGELPEYMFGHPEPITLSQAIEAKNISVRGGICPSWNNRVLRLLRSLGLTKSKGRIDAVAGFMHAFQRPFSIGGLAQSALRVDVIGRKDEQERHLVFNMVDRMRLLAAIPCAVAALMLLEGKITRRGVMAPEMCIEPVEFFDRLSDKGVKIMREGRL